MRERVFAKDGLRVTTSTPKAATQLLAEGYVEQIPEPTPAPEPVAEESVPAEEPKPRRRN